MRQNYGALRLWSTVLIVVGVLGVAFVVIGTVVAVMEAVAFWQTLAILLISGPLVAVFASRPLRWDRV